MFRQSSENQNTKNIKTPNHPNEEKKIVVTICFIATINLWKCIGSDMSTHIFANRIWYRYQNTEHRALEWWWLETTFTTMRACCLFSCLTWSWYTAPHTRNGIRIRVLCMQIWTKYLYTFWDKMKIKPIVHRTYYVITLKPSAQQVSTPLL